MIPPMLVTPPCATICHFVFFRWHRPRAPRIQLGSVASQISTCNSHCVEIGSLTLMRTGTSFSALQRIQPRLSGRKRIADVARKRLHTIAWAPHLNHNTTSLPKANTQSVLVLGTSALAHLVVLVIHTHIEICSATKIVAAHILLRSDAHLDGFDALVEFRLHVAHGGQHVRVIHVRVIRLPKLTHNAAT